MRPRHLVRHPLTLQSWQPEPSLLARILGELLWWIGGIALGAGLAVILQALHKAGVTP
ncbi:MAG: hypothetical protein ABSD47_01265 [Candidatus Methylomirabilota bacterium]|jgi:hypothetical protein